MHFCKIIRKNSIIGPINKQTTIVPIPIGPPNNKPTKRAPPSIKVVATFTDNPNFLCITNIKVSIGPAPKLEKMVSAAPREIRTVPKIKKTTFQKNVVGVMMKSKYKNKSTNKPKHITSNMVPIFNFCLCKIKATVNNNIHVEIEAKPIEIEVF